ncbi:hypothetical protein [Streptomyces sp. RKAG293]|uniref:hypothetical protein n=1 Tax=Streptomyces sp. RKAG293 TaxID=2893403 RepID=UPI002034622D|nr:hypothetical protein [Streptomyces sp. RKAG293]MCM2416599.1 hypothetical protein [Streptomyces sp. RKAG293]
MSGQSDSRPSQSGTERSARRRAAAALTAIAVVTLLAGTGCSSSKAAPAAKSTTAAVKPASDGGVVKTAQMRAITLPRPQAAPATGKWDETASINSDGDRQIAFVDGTDTWMSLHILDCRQPLAKAGAKKPPTEQGDFLYCYKAATGSLKGYPLFANEATLRVLTVGNLRILADIGIAGDGKIDGAAVESFLGSFDLASIAKL